MGRQNMKELLDNDIYDDYMEPLSNIRGDYQRFSIRMKEYAINEQNRNDDFVGGVPILGDMGNEGVYVDAQDTHTLVIGSTGSKKTRLIVMPTVRLLGWANESMIISDPKAEIYYRTAGELETQGYRIVVLNFREPNVGDTWNPLDIPYRFYKSGNIDRACEMVNDIAKNIIAADQKDADPFWMNSAADMFFGLVLTLFKLCIDGGQSEMAVNISNVLRLRRQLFDQGEPEKTAIWKYVQNDEVIAPALSGIVMTVNETRAGILSTFDQKVRFFVYQPNLMDMLANNSIRVDKISDEKTAVYLIMPDEKTTYHALISLFVKQSYEYLIFSAQSNRKAQLKIRLNYILDEFSSLPTIKDFPSMITAARSRNIRFHLVMQSKHQLRQRYGDETETIQSNCGNWIFLTSREVPLLEEVSKLCGTVQQGSIPLVSIFALQHLDKENGQALILSGRKRPFYAELPDIDIYDNKKYLVRKNFISGSRKMRVEISGNDIVNEIIRGNRGNMVFDKIVYNEPSNPFLNVIDEINIEEKLDDILAPEDEVEQDSFFEYGEAVNMGYELYNNGKYDEAKECFIAAINYWPIKFKACDGENNLAYMLRRKEIANVEIGGVFYSVPEILEKGVNERRPFFLINMALYCCQINQNIELSRGNFYIKKIDVEDVDDVKQWWEGVAEKGEVEGYIVLFWLYMHRLINNSSMGSKTDIANILESRYKIDIGYYDSQCFQAPS